jgi:hypothetical protein
MDDMGSESGWGSTECGRTSLDHQPATWTEACPAPATSEHAQE